MIHFWLIEISIPVYLHLAGGRTSKTNWCNVLHRVQLKDTAGIFAAREIESTCSSNCVFVVVYDLLLHKDSYLTLEYLTNM
jgi:hypothetical protein